MTYFHSLGETCLDKANRSGAVANVDAWIKKLSTSWYPTGYYTPAEIDKIVGALIPLTQKTRAAVANAPDSTSDAVSNKMNAAHGLIDIEAQLVQYQKSAATARQSKGIVDAPNMRAFVIRSLLTISEALVLVSVLECNTTFLDTMWDGMVGAAKIVAGVAGVAANAALAVGGAVVKAVETTAGIAATIIKFAPYAALGIGAYFLYGYIKKR